MRLNVNKNVVLLPDGSLFFLTTKNSDTGLYHCATDDQEVISYPAALIVGTEEEGIIPTDTAEEDVIDVSDISIEIQDIPADRDHEEIIPLEVMTDAELSSSIYIISMVIVAILTIVIIIGAALIFNKIKKVNNNTSSSDSPDRESTAPMMYAVPRTLDT